MEELIGNLKSQTDLKYGRTLKRLTTGLSHPSRTIQTSLSSFIADCYKNMTKCDVMLVGSGSIRVKTLGPIISLQDMMEAYPYKDILQELTITGKQLKAMLTYTYRNEAFEDSHTEFYQLSDGMHVEYSKSKQEITKFEYYNKPIKDDQLFLLVIKNYHINSFKNSLALI